MSLFSKLVLFWNSFERDITNDIKSFWASGEPDNKKSDFGEAYMVAVQPEMKFDDKNAEHRTQVICQVNSEDGL